MRNRDRLAGALSLCWGSMEGVGLKEFIEVAADADFAAITLNPSQHAEAKAAGFSDTDLCRLIQDHGLVVSNIDPLFNWLPSAVQLEGDDVIAQCTRASVDEIFHFANAVDCDLVNAPLGLATPDSEQQIVDCFAGLCERAAAAGLQVSLEFMPFNQVNNLSTASRIVEKAGCGNGGIMFDCWHHHRGGGVADDVLQVPGEQFIAIQLDDALTEPMPDILEETLNHRLLPGEGCIDLPQTLRNLDQVGATLIFDVEVFKAPLRSLSARERASAMYESSHALMQQLQQG